MGPMLKLRDLTGDPDGERVSEEKPQTGLIMH